MQTDPIEQDIQDSFSIERVLAMDKGLVEPEMIDYMAKAFEKDTEIRDDINIVTAGKVPKYTRRQVHQELYDLGSAEFEVLFQNKDDDLVDPE